MNRSDRRPVIQAAARTLHDLAERLPDLLHALTDSREANETGRRAKGPHSDPTLSQVSSLVAGTEILDAHLHAVDREVRALHAMLARHLGPEYHKRSGADLEPVEDLCQSHYRVRDRHDWPLEVPLWVTDPDTKKRKSTARNVRLPDPTAPGGSTPWRVCRWCSDVFNETGRLPTEDEIRVHENRGRVYHRQVS